MNSNISLLLVPFLVLSANAKTCDVSLKLDNTTSNFIITKCNDGEASSVEYKSKAEAIRDYVILTQSWAKAWKSLGCKSEELNNHQSCTFEKPVVVEKIQTPIGTNSSLTSISQCEEAQILEVKKSKDNISKAAIAGLGSGAIAGAAGAAGMAVAMFPFISTTMALDGGRSAGNLEKDIAIFVIGGAVVLGAVTMVGTSTSAWMNHQTTDKLANRNLVFFRDIRSDGVGPEFEVRAQMILQSLKLKKVYFGQELTLIDKFFSKPLARKEVSKAISRMKEISLPQEILNIENIKNELKFVGEAYLSKDSLLECGDPKELYLKISLHTISKLLNKYIK